MVLKIFISTIAKPHVKGYSDYSDLSLTTRSPERRFFTSIALALHLAQPHCASVTISMDTRIMIFFLRLPDVGNQGHREGGQGGTMIPGPVDFRESMKGPMGFFVSV